MKFNRLAWNDVRAEAEKRSWPIGKSKKKFWKTACQNAYSMVKYPLLKDKKDYL